MKIKMKIKMFDISVFFLIWLAHNWYTVHWYGYCDQLDNILTQYNPTHTYQSNQSPQDMTLSLLVSKSHAPAGLEPVWHLSFDYSDMLPAHLAGTWKKAKQNGKNIGPAIILQLPESITLRLEDTVMQTLMLILWGWKKIRDKAS